MLRGSFAEMRAFNRNFPNYVGIGGFGGMVQGRGVILESSSVNVGVFLPNEGFETVDDPRQEGIKRVRFETLTKGWGLRAQYQFIAFLNGKADKEGIFLRWGTSLDVNFFTIDYKGLDEEKYERKELLSEQNKSEFYLNLGGGYRFDLGFSNLLLELNAGVPTITSLYRTIGQGKGKPNGEKLDMDEPWGLPYYWGLNAGIML